MSVPMAIALSGQLLLGQQVMVKPSEAEKNLVQSTASSSGAASGGARKLYLNHLDRSSLSSTSCHWIHSLGYAKDLVLCSLHALKTQKRLRV